MLIAPRRQSDRLVVLFAAVLRTVPESSTNLAVLALQQTVAIRGKANVMHSACLMLLLAIKS